VPGIPCPWCAAEGGATEVLEGVWGGISSGAGWVLRNSLGAEELDEGEDEAQSCGETTDGLRYEVGTRREVEEEEEETAKLGHSKTSNPEAPDWMPSGTVTEKILALLGKLFSGI
jgi:hypothetical protein